MCHHNLNCSYEGGLNSYGLAILFLAFIAVNSQKSKTFLIEKFLNFFGTQFDCFCSMINIGYQLK